MSLVHVPVALLPPLLRDCAPISVGADENPTLEAGHRRTRNRTGDAGASIRQLSLGPVVAEFEEKFAAYAGTRFAIATNSGTSALHLAWRHGIGAGDEVLTTSFSFVASVNCLLYEGAMPVFADIDPATLNIDHRTFRDVIAREYIWDRAKTACESVGTNTESNSSSARFWPAMRYGADPGIGGISI